MYIIPPYRFTVYAIGILLGYCLRHFKDLKLTELQLNIGWMLSMSLLFSTIIGTAMMSVADYEFSSSNSAKYSAFAPISWCLFFAWVIFTSQLGQESMNYNYYLMLHLIKSFLVIIADSFHKLLSWRGFLITTKLSYGIYLTQFAVFHYNVGQQRSPQHFSLLSIVRFFFITALFQHIST